MVAFEATSRSTFFSLAGCIAGGLLAASCGETCDPLCSGEYGSSGSETGGTASGGTHATGPGTEGTDSAGSSGTTAATTGGAAGGSVRIGSADGSEEVEVMAPKGGGYVLAGGADGFSDGAGDGWIVELAPEGNIAWQGTVGAEGGPDMITDLLPLADGGVVATGWTQAGGAGGYDLWVVRLAADHSVVWSNTYGGGGDEQGWAISRTPGGNFVVSGGTTSFGAGMADYWVLALAPDGTIQWQQTIGGADDDCGGGDFEEYALRTVVLGDGTVVAACDSLSFGAGGADVWVVGFTPDGQVAWQNAYGGAADEFAWDTAVAEDGSVLIGGVTESFSPDASGDIWVLRLAPDGTVAAESVFGLPGVYAEALTVAGAPGGGFAVGGAAYPDGDWQYLLLSVDPSGTVRWMKDHQQGWSWPNAVVPAGDGSVRAAGVYWGGDPSPDVMDLWVLKTDPQGLLEGCDLVADLAPDVQQSSAVVTPTTAMPMPTQVVPQSYDVAVTTTDAAAVAACDP